jgi:hypothetical protein
VFANPEVVFGGTQRLLSLIELIYSAVNQPTHWSLVLEEIAELVDGESTALWASSSEITVQSFARMDPVAWNLFTSYYASINVWMERADAVVPDGVLLYSNRVIADNELEQTEFYNDYLSRHNMQYAAGVEDAIGKSSYCSHQLPASKIERPLRRPRRAGLRDAPSAPAESLDAPSPVQPVAVQHPGAGNRAG